ncbi:MAG: extracellular solute-binding protein [Actinomycetota bacterium]
MAKRTCSTLAAAVACVVTAAACGGATSLDEPAASIFGGDCVEAADRSVTIYSGRTQNLIEPVLDAFSCETGIDVAVRWGDSVDLALLLSEEGERSRADVFLSRSPGPVGFLEGEGLLAPLAPEVLDLVGAENRSGQGTWIGFSGRKRVLVRNVDLVGDDELPGSVFDLTDPRYEGQVAIPATNGSFVDWFTVFRDQYGDDVATEWLDAMVTNGARPYANNRSIVDAVNRGEIEMGLVNHYYTFQEAAASADGLRAANHELADDDIGSLLIITAASVTSMSERPEEANELIAYLLSEPVQRYFSNETFEYPLAAGVEPLDILPPLTALEIGSVDFDNLGGGFTVTNEIIEASGILDG